MADSPSPQILVVGSLNMDLTAFTPRLPFPGETMLGNRWEMACGGKGGNQAVAAARLGARVAMIGRVGQDAYGIALRNSLISQAIDCEGILSDADQPTGMALIAVGKEGQNIIIVIPGCNGALTTADIEAHATQIAAAKIVVCQLETPLATVRRAVELAAKAHTFVIVNPAPAPEPDALDREFLECIDLLIPNETEAAALTGLPVSSIDQAMTAASALRARGARDVIVTLGPLGVVHVGAHRRHHYPAPSAVAIDATAAGDTFIGAVAASLSKSDDVPAAIHLGQL